MSEVDNELQEPLPETAQQLLDDLSKTKDFPALSHIIAQVNRISTSESSRTDELTETILKDVSLTNKLLRIVNAAHYGQFAGRASINTISRAIVILGYNAIRDAALSLMLFEHLNNHSQAAELKAEAVESFFCGILGRGLAAKAGVRDTEEVMICALFHNMGRMMCRLHFFEKTKETEAVMEAQGLNETAASRQVFGLSYDEFGQALGHHWHLPTTILQGMAPLPPGPVKAPANDLAKVQTLASMAHELYITTKNTPPEQMHKAIAELGKKYGQAVNIHPEVLLETVYHSSELMEKESRVLQVDVRSSPLMARLLKEGRRETEVTSEGEALQEAEAAAQAEAEDPTSILITGLQDLTSMLLGDFRPTDLLHLAAELLFRSQCFDRVCISTIAASGKELVGRICLGPDAERIKRTVHIPVAFTPDVFHAAIGKSVDILIADTQADNIRGRIPTWHREMIGAKSFLLLPISLGNRTVALIYADKQGATLSLPQQTLSLIKALRNQIALALRQKSYSQ